MNNINDKIKQIDTENFIWIIYIGIIVTSWIANDYEKRYFLFQDNLAREKYRKLLIIIFSILIVIYLYFLKSSINDINKLSAFDSKKKKRLVYLSFVGSLFIALSGVIFLYIAIYDSDIDVEIAFN